MGIRGEQDRGSALLTIDLTPISSEGRNTRSRCLMEEKMQQEEEAPAYEGNVPELRDYKGHFLRMDGW